MSNAAARGCLHALPLGGTRSRLRAKAVGSLPASGPCVGQAAASGVRGEQRGGLALRCTARLGTSGNLPVWLPAGGGRPGAEAGSGATGPGREHPRNSKRGIRQLRGRVGGLARYAGSDDRLGLCRWAPSRRAGEGGGPDSGSHTLGNLARAVGGFDLPCLESLGLGCCRPLRGMRCVGPRAAYGVALLRSRGKDSTTGHWEICGVLLERPFPTYPSGFPQDVIAEFKRRTGRGVLANKPASGTAIIGEYGEEHQRTGKWIVYTSA